eukprot:TRINITY_DN2428_c0_g2_i3.p1 TRINITY_DN2428_c0_g2~~TRINITY_DN2428_c0_g2_i3.p1  ORF type:complete len:860 (-),score=111.87 TRINITY_DN2428_c0_g2_i3:581-3160(-)
MILCAALGLMEMNLTAVIGPQYSVLAHIVSHIATHLKVPLISFAATDPTLTSYEYPYFIRMTHNDYFQMGAIADFVGYFGWKQVVAIYIDDDYGRNGISALGDALLSVGAKITRKEALIPGIDQEGLSSILAKLILMETRIFVVHMNSNTGIQLFSAAKNVGMLGNGYVWIVTDWLSSVLDSGLIEPEGMSSFQGLVALRPHFHDSQKQYSLKQRWKTLQKEHRINVSLNSFGLYAYDSVWMIAYAIDSFLNQGATFTFVQQSDLLHTNGSKSDLATLKVLDEGPQVLKTILKSKFDGVTGPIQFDSKRDLLFSSYEIINIAGTGYRRIGYWSNDTGLSVTPPEATSPLKRPKNGTMPKLHDVIWPGESKSVPRGWVLPENGRQLVIGVPRKSGFREFVTIAEDGTARGFCIDVFAAAVNLLPYSFQYTFMPYSPDYDKLVDQLARKNLDAVVGDISIVTNRTKVADFTQPYVESGLAVVVPVKEIDSNAWAFLRPFTLQMWLTTGVFFLIIGAVVWILEHKINPEFRGHPKEQFMNVLWFSFSTLFFAHRENTLSTLGRGVLLVWLFVVLIINSSYTASLTSILTVQQLSPTIQGIDGLISSTDPIGYQAGSFVAGYLSQEFNIAKSRLVPLDSPESYNTALTLGPDKGGVSAVVDELPYIQLFQSKYCGYTTVGQEFTKSGWGFAFRKDSPLQVDMSTAILSLSENGELQRLHDKWLSDNECNSDDQVQSYRFGLKSFWGLFLLTGIVCFLALLIFFVRMIYEFVRHADAYIENVNNETPTSNSQRSLSSKSKKVLKSFASFVDEREEERRERLKRKKSEREVAVVDGDASYSVNPSPTLGHNGNRNPSNNYSHFLV